MSNIKLLFSGSSSLTPREKKKKRKLWNRYIGVSLVIIQIIISIMFLVALFHLNVIPNKYLIILIVVLVLITAFNLFSQYTKANILGKIIAVLLSIVLLFGFLFVSKTSNALNDITKPATVNTTGISVIVLSSDPAQKLSDAQKYKFGYNSAIDKSSTDIAVTQINEKLGSAIDTTGYADWDTLVNALYNHEVKAIILNETYRSAIEETYIDFGTKTKVIDDSISIENQNTAVAPSDINVSTDAFTIYIAGNDQAGAIASTGRNDVNIIATFNPKTKQALLVTTPRDYYIPVVDWVGNTGLEKLTHAGNFGVQGSMTALKNLYGVNLDYYVKINFTGTVGIVNALGGITIDSEVGFKSSFIPYTFVKGQNNLDGEKTLAFCRERYAFANGDFQRGRDQMAAVKGIIAKASSPAIITNYSAVLNSVSSLFGTNMPADAITSLIKDTLDTSTPWNIQTYDVSGSTATRRCQLYGFDASVVLPDYSTVNTAVQYMNKIKSGETFQIK
ncbi:LCP family protein [[Clostridium] fimetarium]|nr:LCP family protein [[Clostridium] fimetarium]